MLTKWHAGNGPVRKHTTVGPFSRPTFVLSLSLFFFLLSTSCTDENTNLVQRGQDPTSDEISVFEVDLYGGLTYSGIDNTTSGDGNDISIKNPRFWSQSGNGRYLIYSAVEETLSPEVFLQESNGATVQLTHNDLIESHAVVNDNGDYAYLLNDHTNNTDSIYLNDQLIEVSNTNRSITDLAISRSYLAIAMWDKSTDLSYIELRDLATGEIANIESQGLLEEILFVSDSKLAAQLFDTTDRKLTIYVYDVITSEWHPQNGVAQGDQYMRHDERSGDLLIDVISGDPDLKILFAALCTWKTHYIGNAFAYSNNFLGRLSWTSSYVIEGLVELYRVTGHPLFALQVRNSVSAQLRIRNSLTLPGDSRIPDFLWATKKYSLDYSTPLTLFVNDARVLYPMLVAANEGLLSRPLQREVVATAEQFIEYLEPQYDSYERLYHIRYGIHYWLDGVWGPYNWQSAVGLVLVELHAATGDERYLDRANELAQRFRSEWLRDSNDRVVWSYWPSEYWAGWNESDGVSVNTPSRPVWSDPYFEDLSHAGLNLRFVLEHRAEFGPVAFSDSDIDGVRETVKNFVFGTTFSRFMSGDVNYLPPLFRNLPLYGWSQLDSQDLAPYYASFIPGGHPSLILSLAQSIHHADDNASLTVNSYRYRVGEEITLVETAIYSTANMVDYFGLH